MKVLLINPYNIQDQIIAEGWRGFEYVFAPLGLCYIASHLRQFNNNVEILDCFAERMSLDEVLKK